MIILNIVQKNERYDLYGRSTDILCFNNFMDLNNVTA